MPFNNFEGPGALIQNYIFLCVCPIYWYSLHEEGWSKYETALNFWINPEKIRGSKVKTTKLHCFTFYRKGSSGTKIHTTNFTYFLHQLLKNQRVQDKLQNYTDFCVNGLCIEYNWKVPKAKQQTTPFFLHARNDEMLNNQTTINSCINP